MTTDPEWLQAARLLRLDCAEPPEALELEQIARLQHPAPKAWRERADLLKALRLDIEAGSLSALERTRTEDVTEPRTVPDLSAARRTWVRRGLFGEEHPPMKTIAVKVGERPVHFHLITRAAFAAWPGLPEAKRSEGIRAWLRPLEQAEAAHQEEAAAPETLTPTKRAAIIERLGRRYPALESALDRPEEWAKACRVPDRRGWYYLESIEAECRARYGGAAPAHAADLSPAGQLRSIGR